MTATLTDLQPGDYIRLLDLPRLLQIGRVERVVTSSPAFEMLRAEGALKGLEEAGVDVRFHPVAVVRLADGSDHLLQIQERWERVKVV